MGGIFGGSKSTTSNQNNGLLTQALSPVLGLANTAGNAISNLLVGHDMSGFNAFKNAAGFNAAAQQGSQGIMGNAAARGLLRSGSTGQALVGYGDQLTNQYMGNYLQNLMGMGQLGIGAGNTLAGSGQTSTSKSKPGLGGFLGGALTGGAL